MGISDFTSTRTRIPNMLPHMGSLHLQSYARGDGTDEEHKDYVVVIPSLHPGAASYGTNTTVSHLFTMTAAIVWLAISEAAQLADSREPKHVLCERIIARVSAKTSPETKFGKLYQAIKDDYSAQRGLVRRLPKSSDPAQAVQ